MIAGPPPRPAGAARPSAWPVFLACGIAFVLASLVCSVLVLGVAAWRARGQFATLADQATSFTLSALGFIATNALNALVLFGVAFVGARAIAPPASPAVPAKTHAGLRLGPSRATPVGFAAAVAGMIGLSFACGAAVDLLHARGKSIMDVLGHALASPSPARFVLGVLSIGLAPAVAEESLFRGLLQTRLMDRWGPTWGIVASAATFGVFHVDPVQGAAAFVAGVFLGWASVRLGGIRPTILAHAVNNVLFVGLASYGSVEVAGGRTAFVALAGGALVCFASAAILASGAAVRAPSS